MGFLDFIRRGKKEEIVPVDKEERSYGLGLHYNLFSSYQNTQALRLSAVYAAVNQISNTIASLPIKIIKTENGKQTEVSHQLWDILNLKPNLRWNHFNFIKHILESAMLDGNGYALIERDEQLNVKAIHPIGSQYVTPLLENNQVKYIVAGFSKAVDAVNMIHIYQHCDNMGKGISTIKYADMTLQSAYDAEEHSDNFFKSGAGLMGILKASAPLTKDQKQQVAESWKDGISRANGGGVAILPQGLEFQSISISPQDSQLLESRKYNVVEIARFFNISPTKLYDLEHTSYNSLEQTELGYLQDTILPWIMLLQSEFNIKLFKPSQIGKLSVEFDFEKFIQTDKKTQAEYFKELINNGILSINEVRSKLGLSEIDGGDKHYMQLAMATVDAINEGTNIKKADVDNKVKEKE